MELEFLSEKELLSLVPDDLCSKYSVVWFGIKFSCSAFSRNIICYDQVFPIEMDAIY